MAFRLFIANMIGRFFPAVARILRTDKSGVEWYALPTAPIDREEEAAG